MNILKLFFHTTYLDQLIQSLKEDNEALVDRLNEAYRLYCAECKRGFSKYVGKAAHDRLLHSPNPTILKRKTVPEQSLERSLPDTNNNTIPNEATAI